MSLTYGFYNSLNGDRKYDAEQMASIFDGLIVDGIFSTVGTAFSVQAAGGLTVNVGIGRAWFDHTWTLNDSILPIVASASEMLLDRIDAVVLETNGLESVRANSIKIIEGTPATTPMRPTLENEGRVHQHPLAYIYRKSSTTEIVQADITNMVGTEETPFVTGILQTISLDELLGQWQNRLDRFVADEEEDFTAWKTLQENIFTEWANTQMTDEEEWILSMQQTFTSWFANLQTQLSGDVAGNLQLQLDREEVDRILLSGFADGSKVFNADGTVIVSTAADGRTLTKTFTNGFLTATTILRSAENGEIARMVKEFSPDGTLIETTTTYL